MLPLRKRASCFANGNCPLVNLFICLVITCEYMQHYKWITSVGGHVRGQRSQGLLKYLSKTIFKKRAYVFYFILIQKACEKKISGDKSLNQTLKLSMLCGLFSDALQMVKVSYALTLSATMIPYSKGSNDDALFEGIVQGMV